MTGLASRLRRRLRPVRRLYRRVRARRPAPSVRTGNAGRAGTAGNAGRVEHVRQVARLARARGDSALIRDALLELVAIGAATDQELRQLRRHAAGRPAPAAPARPGPAGDLWARVDPPTRADLTARVDPPNGSGPLLAVDREPDGGLRATVWTADGRAEAVPDAWRPGWADLPPAVADQLAVGVLTREVLRRGVRSVEAADPITSAIAAAAGLLPPPADAAGLLPPPADAAGLLPPAASAAGQS